MNAPSTTIEALGLGLGDALRLATPPYFCAIMLTAGDDSSNLELIYYAKTPTVAELPSGWRV